MTFVSTLLYLADTFIQSDLQIRQYLTFCQQRVNNNKRRLVLKDSSLNAAISYTQ